MWVGTALSVTFFTVGRSGWDHEQGALLRPWCGPGPCPQYAGGLQAAFLPIARARFAHNKTRLFITLPAPGREEGLGAPSLSVL